MICYNYLTKFFCGSKEVILESEKVYDSTLEENSSINSGDFDDIMRSRVYHRKMSKANNRLIKGIYTKRRNIFFADSRNFRHICEIQRRFENGELGVGPTDTIYCLMCKATNDLMIQRMYAVKNRPNFKPVSFWIPNLEKLSEKDFNPVLWEFMKNLFPTQVSIVLPKGKWLDKILPSWQTSAILNEDSIAMRCPNSPLILGLIEKVGPLAITSANPSGYSDVIDWMKTINNLTKYEDITFVITDIAADVEIASTAVNLKCQKMSMELEYFRLCCVPKEAVDDIWNDAWRRYNGNNQLIYYL